MGFAYWNTLIAMHLETVVKKNFSETKRHTYILYVQGIVIESGIKIFSHTALGVLKAEESSTKNLVGKRGHHKIV